MISGDPVLETLELIARELHLPPVFATGLAAAALLYTWLERRGRRSWTQVPVASGAAPLGPYRSGAYVAANLDRAPLLVRLVSFGGLLFAHVFAPLIVVALVTCPFDAIAIPLALGVPFVVLDWICAWLLLARSPRAEATARTVARVSLVANGGLLCLAAAHFVVIELGVPEGNEHSTSVTFVILLFGVTSVTQALLTLATVRVHGPALTHGRPGEPSESCDDRSQGVVASSSESAISPPSQ